MRLKNKIEKSDYTVTQVAEKVGMQRGSLYYLFTKDEILKKEIQPVLSVLGITLEQFYGPETDENSTALLQENEALKRENELLRDQVEQLKEMIALLKKKK